MLSAPDSLWEPALADRLENALAEVVYRSRLLGSDRSLANEGGGNTSVKARFQDHTGRIREVLYVKGSGSDLAIATEHSFSVLRLDWLLETSSRDSMDDGTMVDHLLKCGLTYDQPRPSIETLLHAFIPATHVDHTHADAVIALTSSPNGPELAHDAFGGRAIWIDYIRPGFGLAKQIASALEEKPDAMAILMAKHGLVTWGNSSLECYESTLDTVRRAVEVINALSAGPHLGGVAVPPLAQEEAEDVLAATLPALRGSLSALGQHMVLLTDRSEGAVDFASSKRGPTLSQVGAACPDHLVNTKHKPLVVECDPTKDLDESVTRAIRDGVARYGKEYQSYYDQNVDAETEQFPVDSLGPRVVLLPGIGLVTAGGNVRLARLSRDLYHRAIEVIGAADGAGGFSSLTEAEAFAVEYWPLERYKLTLPPPGGELEGRVAFVTGAASGIGRATALRLAAAGAHVVSTDINGDGAEDVACEIEERYGPGRAMAERLDVTDEAQVASAVRATVLGWGGIDITVCSAGVASSSSLGETTVEAWERSFDVLVKGYFLVARDTFRVMSEQGIGGSIVFVGSKNGLVAGKSAAAYSSAKAAEIHLARCIAEEGGVRGIRANTINPDAVLSGSSIWDSDWRTERAAAYGIDPDQLEQLYKERSVLKRDVTPEHVAEAIAFFASDRSSRSTGNILNVDAGVTAAYTR